MCGRRCAEMGSFVTVETHRWPSTKPSLLTVLVSLLILVKHVPIFSTAVR